jgi:DNA-binding PadR family transcriptional regulator
MNDDFPILAVIAGMPAHPYRVLDHLQALGVKTARSTLYRRIDGLSDQGLLQATEVRGESGHVHRQLRLTEAGVAAVGADAAQLLRDEPLESPYFALAVDCANAMDTSALPALLQERMARAARRLTEEERAFRERAGNEGYWSRSSRERRIAHLQADLKWLQSVMRQRLPQPAAFPSLPRAG